MQIARGIVVSSQEGRFLLADPAGRLRLMMLAPGAGVEAQDLPDLVRRGCALSVAFVPAKGRRASIAHRLEEA